MSSAAPRPDRFDVLAAGAPVASLPGLARGLQPSSTLYGGAQRFRPGALGKLGERVVEAVDMYGRTFQREPSWTIDAQVGGKNFAVGTQLHHTGNSLSQTSCAHMVLANCSKERIHVDVATIVDFCHQSIGVQNAVYWKSFSA